jgi:hypothetical protein
MLNWYRKGMLHDMHLPTCGAVRSRPRACSAALAALHELGQGAPDTWEPAILSAQDAALCTPLMGAAEREILNKWRYEVCVHAGHWAVL